MMSSVRNTVSPRTTVIYRQVADQKLPTASSCESDWRTKTMQMNQTIESTITLVPGVSLPTVRWSKAAIAMISIMNDTMLNVPTSAKI